MKIVKYLIALFYLIVISSCHNDSKKEESKSTITDEKSKKEIIINDSTVVHMYFSKGQMTDSIPYINDKINGLVKRVKGDTVFYREYLENIQSGLTYAYINQNLLFMGLMKNNKDVGERYEYYSNGDVKGYYCFNDYGMISYGRDYDIDGSITHSGGYLVFRTIVNSDYIGEDNSIYIKCFAGIPPYSVVKLNVYDTENVKSKMAIKSYINENVIEYSEKLVSNKKEVIRRFEWEITDTINNHSESGHIDIEWLGN